MSVVPVPFIGQCLRAALMGNCCHHMSVSHTYGSLVFPCQCRTVAITIASSQVEVLDLKSRQGSADEENKRDI